MDVLGGQAVLKRPGPHVARPRGRCQRRPAEARAAAGGRPRRCRKARLPASLVYRVVPIATFKRRTRLTPEESARTERLARIVALAEAHLGGARRRAGIPEPAASAARRPHAARRRRSPSSARGASSSCCTMSTTVSRSDAACAPTASGRAAIRSSTAPARPAATRRGGTPAAGEVIYAAEHYATAVLEKLAQLNSVKLPSVAGLHRDSRAARHRRRTAGSASTVKRLGRRRQSPQARRCGDRWYDQRRTAALLVPSLAAPGLEWNVIINQQHPDFSRLTASTLRPVVGHPHLLA